jgi:hypothetical protein
MTTGVSINSGETSVDMEQAFRYAESVIDEEFAAHGVPVEITDPRLFDKTVRLLRAGRRKYEAQVQRKALRD